RLTWPTAAHSPGAAQDTDTTSVLVPSDIPCRPMTCCSGPHVPSFSSATKACALLEGSVNHPPAVQLPGAAGLGGQDTERASVLTPLAATVAGSPQVPCTSLLTNADACEEIV